MSMKDYASTDNTRTVVETLINRVLGRANVILSEEYMEDFTDRVMVSTKAELLEHFNSLEDRPEDPNYVTKDSARDALTQLGAVAITALKLLNTCVNSEGKL